ncbi:hypothetical protein HDU91_006376 [Kappamyces sp. JEL0680]|nr:hypothetical protein HDU91_006376 [Kappamyces sp. JEL0680]
MGSAFASLKLREDVLVPDTSGTYKSLPTPEHLTNLDLYHKGPVRTIAVSGFYVRLWYIPGGENVQAVLLPNENKVHAINFVSQAPSERVDISDQFVWASLDRGELIEVNSTTGEISSRCNSHTAIVTQILRGAKSMYTIDENGGVRVWNPDGNGRVSFNQRPLALRIQSKVSNAILAEKLLWTSQGKAIEVYSLKEDAVSLLERRIDTSTGFSIPSSVSAMAFDPRSAFVFAAHESGKISVYSTETLERVHVIQTTSYKITCMVVVVGRLWIGLQTGKILVLEPKDGAWTCVLDFAAYPNTSVAAITVDDRSLLAGIAHLNVVSLSEGGHMRVWDGLLRSYLMDGAIRMRTDDFSSYTPISISMLTYNIDSRKPLDLDSDVLETFVAQNDADIFVFGFQELVDLENKGNTAKTFFLGSNKTAKAIDSTLDERLKLWQERLKRLFPSTYAVVEVTQLVGLFQCIISKNTFVIRNPSVSLVKTGLGGLYGNKGGISTRFMIGDSSFCFVNTHLAAHQTHTSERNKDIAQILRDASFPAIPMTYHWERGGDGSSIMDYEHIFWGGDLNYRIDLSRQAVLDAINESNWPLLWQHDQLLKQKQENPAHGLRSFTEEPLQFAPTFKYNRGSNQYDTSEKMRIPAYCDRILYHGARITQHKYHRLECKMSDHRPVFATFTCKVMKLDNAKLTRVESDVQLRLKGKFDKFIELARQDFLMHYFGIDRSQSQELLASKPFFSFFTAYSSSQ